MWAARQHSWRRSLPSERALALGCGGRGLALRWWDAMLQWSACTLQRDALMPLPRPLPPCCALVQL